MEYQTKPNTGSMFASKSKKTDKSPDYWGDIVVDTRTLKAVDGLATLRVSGWKKVSKAGSVYLSLALSAPLEQTQQAQQPRPAQTLADMEDDIPF